MLNFEVLKYKVLNFKALDVQVLNFEVLDFEVLHFKVLEYEVLDFEDLDFEILDYEFLDLEVLDFKVLNFKILHFEVLYFEVSDFWTMNQILTLFGNKTGEIQQCDRFSRKRRGNKVLFAILILQAEMLNVIYFCKMVTWKCHRSSKLVLFMSWAKQQQTRLHMTINVTFMVQKICAEHHHDTCYKTCKLSSPYL